ncbi:hypothetical protein E0L36_26685 [Streptomyces sp. AJS327]|uniref:hypothetical protein n=1 Tax=Streptomyces sp. AJS327 TaxID=2545265 RepID=UPI0015DEFB0E|nr:hypothetical protein [Streptomyces sp. AJS327]MBA0054307.1 hypothetical protein [Streptomyces sp. AJS327]
MADLSMIIAAVATAWDALRERHRDLPEVSVVIDTTGAPHDLRWPDADGKIHGVPTPPELAVHVDTVREGAKAVVEHVIHVATHALCRVRGVSETSNRGRRHNKRFATMATELGGHWPDGQKPDSVRGFSPVPVTDTAMADMGQHVAALEAAIDQASADLVDLAVPHAPAKNRVYLKCSCDRTLQMGPRVAAMGPVICGVCHHEFTDR